MRRLFLFIILFSIVTPCFSQQGESYVCRLGFTFEMSLHNGWGKQKPVILSVTPMSPASTAGLKVNDIVETINSASTENQMINVIDQWLENDFEGKIKLSVSNLGYRNKEVTLIKDCKLSYSINEKELAEAHAFYSLEDVQSRSFTCPFKTTTDQQSDLMPYKTFGFSAIDESHAGLERILNKSIQEALTKKGLTHKQENPDLLVHTYYSFKKNLNYIEKENLAALPRVSRYNVSTEKMETFPIFYHPLIGEKQTPYLLNLGIRLIDKKKSTNGKLIVVWECESKELVSAEYKLEDYSQVHIPLMLMQYPYPQTTDIAQFRYKALKYGYTGISYHIEDLKEVVDVDRYSPAYQAKFRPKDKIEKINGIKLNANSKDASSIYKQFIYKTMPLRDNKTIFTDANGFTQCMFWDKFQYVQIAETFKKPEFSAAYAYLFYFEPYTNLSGTNTISFDIVRDKQRLAIKVNPVIRTETSFENYK